jgi:peptidoglycan/xylan/chitin deacetylase (PgdA/CDA1 family)
LDARWGARWQAARLVALAMMVGLGVTTGGGGPAAAPAPSTGLVLADPAAAGVVPVGIPWPWGPQPSTARRPSLRTGRRLGTLSWRPLAQTAPVVRLAAPTLAHAPVDGEVRVQFSVPVDPVSAERSFRIQPDVGGELAWADEQTLVFRPASRLAYRTAYQVSVVGLPTARRGLAAVGQFTFGTVWPPPAVPFPFTLTFDDCGTADAIHAILDVLADRGLHAIFFPTGQCRDQFPWLIPTLLAAGHRVCNHTYSHPVLPRLSSAAIASEIQRGVSVGCDLFRPPYGALDAGGRVAGIAASLGYRIQLWDVDTRDWAGTPADVMVAMIRAKGGVVLFHMHGVHTVEALRAL